MTICKRLRAPCFAGAALLFALGASMASADIATSQLNVTNTAGFTGPFGLVTVDLTSSSTAVVTFTSQTGANGDTYYFIDSSAADVNVNATSWSIGGYSVTAAPGANTATLSDGGSGVVDGFGTFNQTVNASDATPSASSEIDFTLTDTSGTWSSATNVLTFNAQGYDAAAHVVPCTGTNISTCLGGSTQYVAESTPFTPVVPEPSAIVLLGSSMIGLGALVRRRRSRLAKQS